MVQHALAQVIPRLGTPGAHQPNHPEHCGEKKVLFGSTKAVDQSYRSIRIYVVGQASSAAHHEPLSLRLTFPLIRVVAHKFETSRIAQVQLDSMKILHQPQHSFGIRQKPDESNRKDCRTNVRVRQSESGCRRLAVHLI